MSCKAILPTCKAGHGGGGKEVLHCEQVLKMLHVIVTALLLYIVVIHAKCPYYWAVKYMSHRGSMSGYVKFHNLSKLQFKILSFYNTH